MMEGQLIMFFQCYAGFTIGWYFSWRFFEQQNLQFIKHREKFHDEFAIDQEMHQDFLEHQNKMRINFYRDFFICYTSLLVMSYAYF